MKEIDRIKELYAEKKSFAQIAEICSAEFHGDKPGNRNLRSGNQLAHKASSMRAKFRDLDLDIVVTLLAQGEEPPRDLIRPTTEPPKLKVDLPTISPHESQNFRPAFLLT